MSQALATLAGFTVSDLTLTIPAWGAWWLDAGLTEPEALAPGARVELRVGDLTASGTVLTGGVSDDRAAYRVVGGAGGWHRDVARKPYRNSAGVKLATILGDLADDTGETLAGVPTSTVAEHYARRAGGAFHVLNDLAPRGWYVDLAGTTRFGARPPFTFDGEAAITRRDKAIGVVDLAVEDPSGLIPGAQVDGNPPATDVEIALKGDALTARVYYAPRTARRLLAWSRIFDALDPRREFRAAADYRVVAQNGDRLDLQAVRVSRGLPDLRGVPVRPGPGMRGELTPGCVVVVIFVDGDPSRPNVLGFAAPDAPGWVPTTIELGGPGALAVARQTDTVVAGPFAGTITGGSTVVKSI